MDRASIRIQQRTKLVATVIVSCVLAACGGTPDSAQPGAAGGAAGGSASPTPAATTTSTPAAREAAPTGASPAAVSQTPATAAAPPPQDAAPPPPAPAATPKPTPKPVVVPAGTALKVRTSSTLSTKSVESGERFVASLESPISVGGHVVAKSGAAVEGKVVNSDPGGRVKGVASMTVQLTSLALANGKTVPISTSSFAAQAKSTKKKDVARVGIGAGAGALIGGIAGGGKGAGIGAVVGGGAGTAATLATRGAPAVIPGESLLTFTLRSPITLR